MLYINIEVWFWEVSYCHMISLLYSECVHMLTPNSSSCWHLTLFLPSVCQFCMLSSLQNSYCQDLLSVCLEVYSCDMGLRSSVSPLKCCCSVFIVTACHFCSDNTKHFKLAELCCLLHIHTHIAVWNRNSSKVGKLCGPTIVGLINCRTQLSGG